MTPAKHLPTAPVPSLSTIDRRSFVPSDETRAWLHSLPLPPGCASQPIPQTPGDWALVEQYRLLVHGLTVLGEYERERRRREQAGEDPFAREWDPRSASGALHCSLMSLTDLGTAPHTACDNPAVISAVESLFKDVFPSPSSTSSLPPTIPLDQSAAPHGIDTRAGEATNAAYLGALSAVQAALGGSAAGVLRPRGVSPSSRSSSSSGAAPGAAGGGARPGSSTSTAPTTVDYGSGGGIGGGHSSASIRLDPATGDMIASLPLSVSDLASLPSHPDPSQIPADGILADHLPLDLSALVAGGGGAGAGGPASLPSLIGAIAELEQCVARLSLEANEARTLQKTLRMEMAARSGGGGGGGSAGGGAAAPGSARAAAKKKKRKAKKRAAADAAASASAAASAPGTIATGHAAAAADASTGPPAASMTGDEALVSGLSGRADDCCSECGESHAAPPHPHDAAAAAAAESAGGLGVTAWEDGELMKALQSVSQLDRRADEYRERLRVLKVRHALLLLLLRVSFSDRG